MLHAEVEERHSICYRYVIDMSQSLVWSLHCRHLNLLYGRPAGWGGVPESQYPVIAIGSRKYGLSTPLAGPKQLEFV